MRGSARFVLVLLICSLFGFAQHTPTTQYDYIVRGANINAVESAIADVDGTVVHSWTFIDSVLARLSAEDAALLAGQGFTVQRDAAVVSSNSINADNSNDTASIGHLYPSQSTGATELHRQGIKGEGVTVAIIDSGLPPTRNTNQWHRVDDQTLMYNDTHSLLVYRDLVNSGTVQNSTDPYGHGTHLISTIADDRFIRATSSRVGIAPDANLVVVRALDEEGTAPYSRIIDAIEWIIDNKDVYDIQVLNLSIQSTVNGPYWYDALNQAVMAAWDEGITVVVAVGNGGPSPVTVMAPANVPYVISVGALMPGRYTTSGHDELARYSSTGPTESKFIKPDVVIPASRTLAPLPASSALSSKGGLASDHARMQLGKYSSGENLNYYYLSGTSMAAAEVSGLVALLLETNPSLTNDQVKFRLMSTANIAADTDGNAVYSVFQQGAGRVNIADAIASTSLESENVGMNLTLDRDHENGVHYMGLAEYDEATNTFSYPFIEVGGSNYASWAGNYASWAGNYASWAGNYASWAGNYASWAGNYASWAGNYASWAGNYASWAGNYASWAGNYASWAGNYGSWAGVITAE